MFESNGFLSADSVLGTWSKRTGKAKRQLEVDIARDFHGICTRQYNGRWLFLNTTYWDFSDESGSSPCENDSLEFACPFHIDNGTGLRPDHINLQAPPGHPLSHYPQVESYLLSYFVQLIGPNCSLSPLYNPYLSLVMPIALDHQPLRNTLLAISANQLKLLGDNRFEKEAYIYKQKALCGLQTEINERKPSYGSVATVLMLCFHDVRFALVGALLNNFPDLDLRLDIRRLLPIVDHASSRRSSAFKLAVGEGDRK